ncbi:MAG: tRNA (adenosine(37)-N6)-threonylcarbamoyltransferase complex dimerization subunit type 1 TsaB [Verrucomicrobia bacterium]|nr:MAG: tRNA (adenosine(37)-N6)-threonylcarbamoyltransferase complex dimerization subunit type 1 TsaB [Verrucomicrobiota bacterium]
MKTLALEVSTAQGSIAWREDGEALFDAQFAADRKHSGAFFENVEQCLERFGRPEQIIVGLGPGSYAGVRIAIATALGLRSAAKAKLTGIPSVCALDVETADYCVIGDARRQSFFFAKIEGGRLTEGPALKTPAELETTIEELKIPVYASEALPQFSVAKLAYPAAGRLAEIARLYSGNIDAALEPIYLREPHITVAKATPGFAPTR